MLRLFVALALPAEIKSQLAALSGGIPGAKWVPPENYHLTLRFIGGIETWRAEIEAGVRAMQDQGKIAADVDPTRTAAALLAGIQGGVSVLLNTGDIGYLEAALDVGIEALHR